MPHRAATAATLIAALATLLALTGGHHPAALATASALTLLTAALWRATAAALLSGATHLAHVAAATRSSLRDTAFLPQRDPDAAGKPRPRAPGVGFAAA